jgi:hypothetical protein
MKTLIYVLAAASATASAMANDAQDAREKVLRQFFEGRSVTVFLDMPASYKGVDLAVGQREPLDAGQHARRLVEMGVSLREGTKVLITRINLKDDLIEFHLGGGGFNPIWNGSGAVSASYGKSEREKQLEKDIKREDDPRRKRDLQRELDRVREHREREEARSRAEADEINAARRDRDQDRALGMGSRFNVRFGRDVPPSATTPQGLMEILSPWVDFGELPGGKAYARRRVERPAPEAAEGPDGPGLRSGMSRSEVAGLLGPAEHEESRNEGDLHKAVAIFRDGGRRMELTFVNGVLVQFKELR